MRTILYILMVITSFWLISCGAKKKSESKTIETAIASDLSNSNFEVKNEENLQVDIKVVTNEKTKTTTTTKTTRPIDHTKPSSVTTPDGKKTILDNAEIIETETTQETENNSSNSSNFNLWTYKSLYDQLNTSVTSNSSKIATDLEVDKKQWNPWSLSWLLLIVPVCLVWKYRSKILSKIWWV